MTPADPIRPGSALTDGNLRAAKIAELDVLEAAAAGGGSKQKRILKQARDTYSLLAAYPWQRVNYRFGRWQAEQTGWKYLISLSLWDSYHWARSVDVFQLLDPYTGAPIGELSAPSFHYSMWGKPDVEDDLLHEPGGALEIAGDPTSLVAYRPFGGSPDTIRFAKSPWSTVFPQIKAIELLRTGQADRLPPAGQPVDYAYLDMYRAWFADEPNKPARKAPWAGVAILYRPGDRITRRPK
ncbi:hypothetical protein [Winogradskya humida]|uniref:Uncharacterized protein n=1 Tax=Winogradskya humida TaxID=113566 RepID=A0ABQ4A2U6_9ACTN|nr:hypothetical protein [Actinoplanes humidus]GIE25158.1 hypothetical protein Ahu01nite_082600 [Actinoplanes humidus]